MARLLRFPSAEQALIFCEMVGLPLTEDRSKAIFKVGPLSISGQKDTNFLLNKRNDEFVFAGCSSLLYKNEERKEFIDFNQRVDSDGVRIPPSDLLWKILY